MAILSGTLISGHFRLRSDGGKLQKERHRSHYIELVEDPVGSELGKDMRGFLSAGEASALNVLHYFATPPTTEIWFQG